MKHIATTVFLFFVMLFAYTKLAGPIPFSVTSVTTQKTDTFTVSGEGKVESKPDMAVVSVGVQAQGATVKAAQQELNSKINAVSGAIKKLGVADADIQTANYNISQSYNQSEPRGYAANTNLIIKVRDIDRANSVIDAATAAGANQVGGVSFDVADRTKAENEARKKAVAEAKKKAQDAASVAGFTLGKIINYSEGFGGVPVPMYAKAMDARAESAPTQVEPGTSEIRVSVSLSYEIR